MQCMSIITALVLALIGIYSHNTQAGAAFLAASVCILIAKFEPPNYCKNHAYDVKSNRYTDNYNGDNMDKRLERILPKVQKPARYTGGEYNQIIKTRTRSSCGWRSAFPIHMR